MQDIPFNLDIPFNIDIPFTIDELFNLDIPILRHEREDYSIIF